MPERIIAAAEFEERLAAICGGGGESTFPRRYRDRQILYRSIIQSLEPGKRYSESGLNTALQRWLSDVAATLDIDHVTLRRYLVDEGYLQRNAEGSTYEVHLYGRGQTEFDPLVTDIDSAGVIQAGRERVAARKRLKDHIRGWRVSVERTLETENSFLAFGKRDTQPVVLKIIKRPGDEWCSGEILKSFDGRGTVRVYDYVDGALLLERLQPGTSLSDLALNGRDDEATDILAAVIHEMRQRDGNTKACATLQNWAKGFERYKSTGDSRIPRHLVEEGHRLFLDLCGSQTELRLLHGDLHHDNVLLDTNRGWLAIDPKGVVGEIEYEIGAILRNPCEQPELFTKPATIERRLSRLVSRLNLDSGRTLAWSFAQAVLSVIWDVEDGHAVDFTHPCIALAESIRPMLDVNKSYFQCGGL